MVLTCSILYSIYCTYLLLPNAASKKQQKVGDSQTKLNQNYLPKRAIVGLIVSIQYSTIKI